MNFEGIIIEESLSNPEMFSLLSISKTIREDVTPEHKTPWLSTWTMHHVQVPAAQVERVAELISAALTRPLPDRESWYADLKNPQFHYVIFRGKIFKVDRTRPQEYAAVVEYGQSIGIPSHQLDFA